MLISTIVALSSVAGMSATPSQLSVEDCNFGEVYAFNRTQCQITIVSSSDRPIHISDVIAEQAGDTLEPKVSEVAPHSKLYLTAGIDTGNGVANVRHVFRLVTDESGHENRIAVARGFVNTVLDQSRPAFNFGVVDVVHPTTRKLELSSHDVPDFRIEQITSAPSYLDVRLAPDARTLEASIRPDAPWGFRIDYVKLKTNTPVQREVWVGVQADIHGAIVASANPFDMGLMRTGNRNEHLIRLTRTDAKDFAVTGTEIHGFKGAAQIVPCEPPGAGCRLLKLTIADDQPLGTVKGDMEVSFAGYKQSMRIAIWGLLVDKDTTIETLDAEKLAKSKTAVSSQSESLSIDKAIKEAVTTAEDAGPPPGKGPLLKWSVANEMLIHGYQIFRGPDENGPFLLLNRSSIPAKTKDNSSASYQWRDNSATSGKTYWYYIGIVYNDGHKQQLTGPQRVVAK